MDSDLIEKENRCCHQRCQGGHGRQPPRRAPPRRTRRRVLPRHVLSLAAGPSPGPVDLVLAFTLMVRQGAAREPPAGAAAVGVRRRSPANYGSTPEY